MRGSPRHVFGSESFTSLALRLLGPALILLLVACDAGSGLRPARNGDSFVRVPLPSGVTRKDLEHPSAAIREQLGAAVTQAGLRQHGDVIVFEDETGNLVLPDAERSSTSTAMAAVSNDITFTYNSPTNPWPANELAAVQGWINAFYPIAKVVYGPPAFSITVNVYKSTSGSGEYFPTTNQIAIGNIDAGVVCHEMLHAFRDDWVIGISAWDEGMTRAAEVEVTKRAGVPDGMDHTYVYDVFYEELDQPMVGAESGYLGAGWSQLLMRYQLSGYAWAKPMLEANSFFANFNAAYYAAVAGNSTVAWTESDLISIAAATKPTVEDKAFTTWYSEQGILNEAPPRGDFVYVRAGNVPEPSPFDFSNIYVSVFTRDLTSALETNRTGVTVQWTVTDGSGALVKNGSGTSNSAGMVEIELLDADIAGHYGPAKITATATPGTTPITSTAYTTLGPMEGVFGIVTGSGNASGAISFTPLDASVAPVTAAVTQGTFAVASLLSVKGRIRCQFTGENGVSPPAKIFTKDDAPYFIHLDTGGVPVAPAGLGATAGNGEASLSWTASPGASSYNVWRSLTAGGAYSQIASGVTATGYTDTGLANGVTYYYVVQAVGASSGMSAYSNQASAQPLAPPPCASPITVAAGQTQVQLNTTAAACYKVTNVAIQGWSCWSWNGRSVSVSGGSSHTDCGFAISPGSDGAYYFSVTAGAYPWAGFGWWGTASSGVPTAPTGVAATPGNTEARLSWAAATGAATYSVLRSATSGMLYALVANGVTATSFTDSGLSNGTTYYYVVRAVGPGGTSPNSVQVAVTPTAATAPCASPIVLPSGTASVMLNTTSPVCYRLTRTIHGWNCSNWGGRTISVNGGTPSATCGFPVVPWFDGNYYFQASAGTYPWASINWW